MVATARFGEAIIDFLADSDHATTKSIRAEDFEGEAYSIYELFSSVWLVSKEPKVDTHAHISAHTVVKAVCILVIVLVRYFLRINTVCRIIKMSAVNAIKMSAVICYQNVCCYTAIKMSAVICYQNVCCYMLSKCLLLYAIKMSAVICYQNVCCYTADKT